MHSVMNDRSTSFGAVASLAGVHMPAPSQVQATGGLLSWCLGAGWEPGGPVEECLGTFVKLADVQDELAFARFARRFGVLGILPNGMPGVVQGEFPPYIGEGSAAWFREPIAGWRGYARHARACLVLTHALQRGERIDAYRTLSNAGFTRSQLTQRSNILPLPDEDFAFWGRLGRFSIAGLVDNLDRVGGANDPLAQHYPVDYPADRALRQRNWLGHHIAKTWLAIGQLAPDIDWTGKTPRVILTLSNAWVRPEVSAWPEYSLVSVLAVQLAAALCTPGRLHPCEGCGTPFLKERSPRCPNCRRLARNRRAREDMVRYRREDGAQPTSF